jgi:hypothetical protein
MKEIPRQWVAPWFPAVKLADNNSGNVGTTQMRSGSPEVEVSSVFVMLKLKCYPISSAQSGAAHPNFCEAGPFGSAMPGLR